MRIVIDIPDEFAEEWKKDRFSDTLHRLIADAHLVAGNYENETAEMLISSFAKAEAIV